MTDAVQFTVRVMPVGAEIRGMDLTQPITPATRKALYQLWLEHGVLVFKETPATNEQHLKLSGVFGESDRHPFPEILCPEEPLLIELGGRNRGTAYMFNGNELRLGRLAWHRDTGYVNKICKGAMLRMVEIPPEGGETGYADAEKAYNNLPAALKQKIENLEVKMSLRVGPFTQQRSGAFWETVRRPTHDEFPHPQQPDPDSDEILDRYPAVVHPVVLAHPETGRKNIYFSPTYVDEFLGLKPRQSEYLLAELTGYMLDTAVTYIHKWKPNELVLWDNRRMLHAAYGYDPKYIRKGLRTTMKETLHSGRYYEAPKANFKASALIAD